uniref:Uncharacterized protein n=1 Tax=Rhizophora mucronata TaxID=61149 RepID=A0A2P2P2H2_RHIMU
MSVWLNSFDIQIFSIIHEAHYHTNSYTNDINSSGSEYNSSRYKQRKYSAEAQVISFVTIHVPLPH